MIQGENIICISSIDWDFVWQGHQEIMSTFAKYGNTVLFIENTGIRKPVFKDIPRLKKRFIDWSRSIKGFRQEMDNLYVYSPVILPFPYSKLAHWINSYILLKPLRRWMQTIDFHNPIIWTFLPTGTALDIINNINSKLVVYYCIADFCKLVDAPRKVMKTENKLTKRCDLIFAQGDALAEKCKKLNNEVYVFPFGVNIKIFEDFDPKTNKVPDDIRSIKKPIIGYIGGIHRHIDFGLIRFVAQAHPDCSVVLIGPIQTDISKIEQFNNVFLLGKKDFSSLPSYVNEFDVSIIPYHINGYTKTVFPTKLNEYHAMGKLVVSTDLPEIRNFNRKNDDIVFVGRDYEEFSAYIDKAIKEPNNSLASKRIESARRNSWAIRIEEMSHLVKRVLDRKTTEAANWQESFLKLYKFTRRRIISIGVFLYLVYFILFYTPFIWLVAEPLKMIQTPQKADCIVVFGGGVGEGGGPGKSTIERARHAVELYKKGYANNIIFSSGYTYRYNDAENMKVFALSMGVRDDDIILEQKADNTYENAKFTKEIIVSNNWDSILLVSSPYNMRRASLTFKKIDKNLKIVYTPVANSIFYFRSRRVRLEQIKAIMHEYLGILYYWWKGYI